MKFIKANLSFLLILTMLCTAGWAQDDMAHIPAGEYEMGDHFPYDRPYWEYNQWAVVHLVYIDAFWMDKYEVTNEEYVEYLNEAYGQGLIEVTDGIVHKAGDTKNYTNTSSVPEPEWNMYVQLHWDGSNFTITQGWEDRPFVQVTWYGAAAFANWKSAKEGLTPCYDLETWECNFDAGGLRLPTEAEWEKASRGGHYNPYYMYSWGSNTTNNNEGNFVGSGDPYEDEMPATTPVGYYDTPNDYGLYDMAGNVWEWCNDWWDYDYPSESPKNNPRGPKNGVLKVNKGGGFHSRPTVNSRNATRCNGCHEVNTPASGNIVGFNVGFRLARKDTTTDIHYKPGWPGNMGSVQSFHNPARRTTKISFNLKNAGTVELQIFNISGRQVKSLVSAILQAGDYNTVWDGRGDHGSLLSSGFYFYTLRINGQVTYMQKILQL
jgi:formylglycine-generating enzyme required for sulfatase activity